MRKGIVNNRRTTIDLDRGMILSMVTRYQRTIALDLAPFVPIEQCQLYPHDRGLKGSQDCTYHLTQHDSHNVSWIGHYNVRSYLGMRITNKKNGHHTRNVGLAR